MQSSPAQSTPAAQTDRGLRFFHRLSFEETFFGWLFIVPAVLGLLFFRLGPVFASFYLSFTKYEIITAPKWTGFANYTKLLNDGLWLRSIEVTLWYVSLFVPLSLTFAYAIALLMSRNVRGITSYRTLWYLPSVVPVVASATIWRWGLNPEFGPINYPLKVLGLPAPRWLTDPDWIVPSIVFIGLWGLGNSVLIFLASITSVPRTFYEAAEVDGANLWARFRHVTLPLTSSIIFYQLIVTVINSFQVFGVAYVLFVSNPSASSAGPDNAALFYVLYMFRNAFGYFRNGYASAMAWILFLVVMLLTIVLFYSQRRWVYYETEGGGS
ncbi:MAG: sugar ABC transporter permease [Caldilineaceae bacterium]|nr:sugar ABC transporter permease [Caldilineaceae bacterium]MDE0630232.1 sugar ABC transporter permease [Caldilineaceae bacterium]MXZ19514.1 sugar ABC transporter permease [Caldilineaceae bacterium SB0665_bin_25]